MNEISTALVSGLVGLVVSGIGTYFGTQWKIRKDLEAKYDSDLRHLRLGTYQVLWGLLNPLSLYGRDSFPTRETIDSLAQTLTSWYFQEGGVFLSKNTRDAYFRLQRALQTLRFSDRWADDWSQELDKDTFEHLRNIGSRLRTRMTLDVGTRRPFSLEVPTNLPDENVRPENDADEGWILEHCPAPSKP
jgi:hypothetical protein